MNYRIVIFILALIFGIAFSIPSLLQLDSGKKINLGLDLQGGLHMLLGVQTNKAIESKYKQIASTISYFCDEQEILIEDMMINQNSVEFTLLDDSEIDKLDNKLKELKGIKVTKTPDLKYKIVLTPVQIELTKEFAINQAVEVIRNRLDQFGLAEPTVLKQGKDKIVVELPGIKTQAQEKRARELISKPANLEMMAIDEKRADQVYVLTQEKAKELGDIILEDVKDPNQKYLLKQIPILNGSQITDARVMFDKNNQPIISFTLSSLGGEIFGDWTGKNIGKRLAVVLDGKVYSAPVVRERIGGGSGQISGSFTLDEAGNIAIALRSGALLAPVYLQEKRSVGPSLGADSIKASMIALVSGFLAVFIFMIIYYQKSGIIANIALITNLFLIIAIMSLFGATLTLPGMAGIVLTVGMAVDANVIINERIRESLKAGHSIAKSIEDGYKNAMSAIMDANITTLLVAVILYAYGTGPIKGFAITMSIGILASMLTAILGTHGMYQMLLPKINKNNKKSWFGI